MTSSLRLSPRDLGLLALLTLAWGLNWPVMKVGVTDFPPMTFRLLCMLGAVPVVGIVARSMGVSLRVQRDDLAELAVLVLSNMVLWVVLTTYGVLLLSSGRAAILAYTMPIWAALLGIVLYGEHPSRRLWIGVAAAALGVLLLVANELTTMAGRPVGTLLMLSASLVWGYGTHRMRRRRTRMHVLAITFWSLASAFVVCLAIVWALERDAWTQSPGVAGWGAVIFNATVIFGFAQPVWFRLATILPPVASGLSVMLIPVLGLFSGILLLGERAQWTDWSALAAVLVAMGTVLLPSRVRR
ncbi:MAG: DMT family transporter [Burkholderiaceae bacterium]|nr:DMT family transporter [Burkholderiaceae bacterium]MCD6674933.1 DMT family transporter [Burkholderiaceae bacterium]